MQKNDWYETGDQIKKLVQDAVDSKDFAKLSSTITTVVDQTLEGLQDVLRENLGGGQQNGSRQTEGGQQDGWQRGNARTDGRRDYTNGEAAERIRRRMQEKRQNPSQRKENTQRPVQVKIKVPGEFSGRVMKWFGYGMSSMMGLSFAIVGVVAAATGFNMALPLGILGVLFGAHFCIGRAGSERLQLAQRFRRYKEVLGERTYCLIEELAGAIGKNSKFVRKDIKKMISRGYFKEGYLDGKGTLLITDRQTYQHYLTAQTEYERREMEEAQAEKQQEAKRQAEKQQEAKRQAEKQQEAKRQAEKRQKEKQQKEKQQTEKNLPQECRELIEEGERYIAHVHECNERIPAEEMSAKLDRLELVITRIFREAEKDPDVVPELKKMMSYYLPTTRKLLDAYCELDEQPIRGQNIEKTKQEIEAALDTINTAFENLLDSLFEETAWDISSDISVLNTMLAQEGLTGTAFDGKNK